MKKLKNKKYFRLLGVGALSLCFGLSACSSNNFVSDNVNNVYEVVETRQRKNITYDDSTYSISYDSNDLNDYDYWLNVINVLIENDYSFINTMTITGTWTGSSSGYTGGNLSTLAVGVGNSGGQYGNYQYWSLTFNSSDASSYVFTKSIYETTPSQNKLGWYTAGSGQPITITSIDIISEDFYSLFAPETPSNNMVGALGDFITILISGIGSLASGVAGGVATMAQALFLEVDATSGVVTGLSVFGGIVALFAGIALAITLTTRVYLWITSLGKD